MNNVYINKYNIIVQQKIQIFIYICLCFLKKSGRLQFVTILEFQEIDN